MNNERCLSIFSDKTKEEEIIMKKFFAHSLPIIALLTACDPADSNPNDVAFDQGTLQHERHFENKIGNAKCEVYATDHSVSVNLKVTAFTDNSYVNELIEADYDNPTFYSDKIDYSGMFKSSSQFCDKMKDAAEKMDDGHYKCSDGSAQVTATLGEQDPSQTSLAVSKKITDMKQYCDDSYDHFSSALNKLAEGTGLTDDKKPNKAEKAQLCESMKVGTSVQTRIVYSDKTLTEIVSVQDGIYSFFEIYEKIDEATFAQICENYKKQSSIKNLVCSDYIIQYDSPNQSSVSLDSYVEIMQDVACPALLDGTMTYEDLIFAK